MATLVAVDALTGMVALSEAKDGKFENGAVPYRRSRRWRQYLAALTANLAIINAGITMAWTAPALPELKSRGVTTEQASWVSACMPLGALVGAIPAGEVANRIGRRSGLLVFSAFFAAGWLLIAFADIDELWLVYMGRIAQGLAVGTSSVFVPVYNQEISQVAVRGALGSYYAMMLSVGILILYVCGAFLPYLWYTLSGVFMTAIFFATFWWMPESPVYLVMKGLMEKARRSLRWLRSPDADLQPELDTMVAAAASSKAGPGVLGALRSLGHTNPLRSRTWRAVGLVLGLMFFQPASGIDAFLFFTVQIFEDAGSNLSGSQCSIVVGCARVLSSFLASTVVDRVGRRPLLLISTIGMTFCLIVFTTYTYLNTHHFNMDLYQWVPLTSIIMFFILYSFGIGPLPHFMMAELLPEEAKGWATSLSACTHRLWLFVVIKFFPVAVDSFGQAPVYATFSVLCFVSILFVALFIPETKGIPKSEIEKAVGGDRP